MIEGLLMLLAIALGTAATSCAKAPQDPAAASYVAEFVSDYGVNVDHIEIRMISLDEMSKFIPGSAGVCVGGSLVVIRGDYWLTLTDDQKKFLVYHELGHCALGEAHRADIGTDGCPTSIMYPSVLPAQCAVLDAIPLIRELGDKRS